MASEWPQKPVLEIATRLAMGPFGSNIKRDNFVTSGVPVIRGNNLTEGRFSGKEFVFLTEAKADELRNSNAFPGDLVFTHRGTLGQVGIIPSAPFARYVVSQSQMVITCDTAKVYSLFLYYFFKSPPGQHSLLKYTSQTGVPAISQPLTSLKGIQVPVPALHVQHRIASILGTLDDKIELNRQMNRTLEKVALAIFKSWFIDFDPVRAKADGRDPGLPAEISELFPDSFDAIAFGQIPRGWTVGSLGEVADSPRRGVKPSDVPPSTPYIGLEHMPRRCIALDAWGRAEEVASGKSQFKQGEILFGKLRPYFHKVGIAPTDGVCSTDIVVVTPKTQDWHGYVISLVSSKAFVNYTDSHSAGTKMPRTNWKDMSRYLLALPPEPLAKAFQQHVATLHKRIGVNVRQNRRLTGLRDTLLPKLMSGEIDIPEAVSTNMEAL